MDTTSADFMDDQFNSTILQLYKILDLERWTFEMKMFLLVVVTPNFGTITITAAISSVMLNFKCKDNKHLNKQTNFKKRTD